MNEDGRDSAVCPVGTRGHDDQAEAGANWSGFALSTAAMGSLAVALLAVTGPTIGLVIAAVACLVATVLFMSLALRAGRQRERKLSDDVTALSQRLLALENGDPARSGGDQERAAALAMGTAVDVKALSRLVTDLAETVGDHDRKLDDLDRSTPALTESRRGGRGAAPVALAPDRQTMRELTSREDFADAASAILRRLAPDPTPEPAPPVPAEPRRTTPADQAIVAALAADTLDLRLQPVVTLPQRRTRYYEAQPFLRGDDGAALAAEAVRPALVRLDLEPRFDALTLVRGFAVARHLVSRGSTALVCCGLSRRSLASIDFVEGAETLFEQDRPAARRILLEIGLRDLDGLDPRESAALGRLVGLGAALVLRDLPDLRQDWTGLVRRGVDFAKVDTRLLLETRAPGTTSDLVAAAAVSGLQLIATGIDRDELVPDLLDYDVPLAQGPAIAPPRPVRAEIVAASPSGKAPPSEPTTAGPPEPGLGGDGRTSFREFLRRAG